VDKVIADISDVTPAGRQPVGMGLVAR
jgi:hypothetical protein